METLITSDSALAILDLCDEGRAADAVALLEGAGPWRKLAEGAIAAVQRPAEAKDLLSEAIRQLSGEPADRGRIWLSCSYFNAGEKDEARITLDTVTPTTERTRFAWALLKSLIESDNVNLSLKALHSVEDLVETVTPLLRGKYLLQRGYLLRRVDDIDGALIAYEEARYWYQIAEQSPSQLAIISNNIAGLQMDLTQFAEAHKSVADAIQNLTGVRLGQAYDQQARIYLAQEDYPKALDSAGKSLALLIEHHELQAESLITKAKILACQGESGSLTELDSADQLAIYLASKELELAIALGRKYCLEKLGRIASIEAIKLALEVENGSFRAAAKRLGISHPAIISAIKKYGIQRKPQRPKPLISRTLKK